MKKVSIFVILLVLLTSVNTKAVGFYEPNGPTGNQFVKWEVLPENPSKEEVIKWLKNAMQGKAIEGAKVRSSAASYITVFGEKLYNRILAAKVGDFVFAKSVGGELNYSLDENGNPGTPGTLVEGINIIAFPDGTPVAKCGTNWCFNALKAPEDLSDGEDPDNGNFTKKKPSPNNSSPNGNTFNFQVSNSISWNEGYGIYSQGRNDRSADIAQDALMFMAIQKNTPSGCNSCGVAQTTAASVVYQPMVSQPQMQAQVQHVAYAQNQVPFGQSFGGQVLANTIGEFAGEGLSRLFYGQQRQVVYNNGGGYYGGGGYYNYGNGGPSQGGLNNGGYNSGFSGFPGGGVVVPGGGFNW